MQSKMIFWALTPIALSGCLHMPMRDIGTNMALDGGYTAEYQHEADTLWNTTSEKLGWWTLYQDDELNTLMKQAFVNSPTLAQVRARLNQAGALTQQSKGSSLPSATLNADRSTQNGKNAQPSDFNISTAASYELDVWNRNRAEIKADSLNEQASREDLLAAHITLSASIVENWLDILSLLEQESLINKQIEVNKTVLSLQQKRFEMGAASALDMLQQEETLARSQSDLPDILSAQKQAVNNIALLLGEVPQEGLRITKKPFPNALPVPQAGLPSNLLANRPDIVAAWLRLLSADWSAQAAWANRMPQFNLTALYSTGAAGIDTLFNTWLVNLAAELTAPIFDGGVRKAEQFRREALADERFYAYRETILTAVNEVENALVSNIYSDQKIKALNTQLNVSHKTLEQAQRNYSNGQSGYINVLNSLNNTQALEQSILSSKLNQAKERVRLYRALGGRSWAQDITAPRMEQPPMTNTNTTEEKENAS